MRILVIGEGGRETAICRALCTASPRPELVITPGNAGTARFGRNQTVAVKDVDGLVALAKSERVDLVIPGGETSLVLGLADRLRAIGIACCGPSQVAAQLEGSKTFTRTLADAVRAPSPRFVTVTDRIALASALRDWSTVPVVKADGLASGKGVFLPDSKAEAGRIAAALLDGELGASGRTVVLEERLVGVEASVFYACNGTCAVPLPHARDHKRIGDHDTGPNTGGMGAISPNPDVSDATEATIRKAIIEPVLAELRRRETPFVGFLYAGIMLTDEGPKLIEFNVRLGDPEAQAVLPRLAPGAFLQLCQGIAHGRLEGQSFAADASYICAIVAAAAGYPDTPRTGDVIQISSMPDDDTCWLDFAGAQERGGKIVTSGGRVLAVMARAQDAASARRQAYAALANVQFDGLQYRKDIGEVRS